MSASGIQLLSAAIIPILFGIALHEVAHGWTAKHFGDRTAELLGRLTLNPLKHIDPIGTIVVPLVLVIAQLPPLGWAKPVPVNARNMRNPKRDMTFVAVAGPLSNLLMAFFWAFVLVGVVRAQMAASAPREFLMLMAQIGIQFNIFLGIFNLFPIPPLDGGRVLRGLVPESMGRRLDAIEPYGLIIVLVLLSVGILGRLLSPVVGAVTHLLLSLVGA
jgi:Zn-dependent protease